MVFNATFNNISVISWRSVLLVEETGENHWPAECHWQTLSHNDVLSTPHMSGIRTRNVIGDRHWFGCSEHLFWFTVFTQCTTLLLFLHSKIFGIKDTSTSVPHFAQNLSNLWKDRWRCYIHNTLCHISWVPWTIFYN
jgi:hypothetical protein